MGLEEALAMSAAAMGGPELKASAIEMMVEDLKGLPADEVLTALARCRRECRGRLALVDILDRIPSYRGYRPPPLIRNAHTPAWQYLGGCQPPDPAKGDFWRNDPWESLPDYLRALLRGEADQAATETAAIAERAGLVRLEDRRNG